MRDYLFHTFLLLKRLTIALVLFSICRILFFLFNYSFFSDIPIMAFVYGIRFDLVAMVFLFLPFIVLQMLPVPIRSNRIYATLLASLFFLASAITIILNCIDFEYFKFTFKRTTSDIFQLIFMGEDFNSLLPQFIVDFWYVVIISLLLMAITVYLYSKTTGNSSEPRGSYTFKGYIIQSIVFLIMVIVFTFGARGGFQLKPLDIIHAGKYVEAKQIPVVLNTPFTIIKTLGKEGLREMDYFTEKDLELQFSPVQQFSDTNTFKSDNVVIIVLESFSREFIGSLNGYDGYTPFLDELISNSLVFDECFANGKKSIEGIPAILAGLPTLMNNPYISSPYSGNKINSLASVLKEKGYTSSFFHGGTNGTMGFDAFAKTAGFDHYFGRKEYNNEADYDGNWGIFDEEFMQYFAKELNKMEPPFFSCLMTLSSHHPYTIPEKHRNDFKDGALKIHRTIRYTDFALQEFFMAASKMPWFEKTLFVITADHASTVELPRYKTSAGMYAIPLLFYHPGQDMSGINHRTTQQADIMPSVLNYLNYHEPFVAFGQSIFNDSAGYSVCFINNVYQMIDGDQVLQFDGKETIAIYDPENDPLLGNNLVHAAKGEYSITENKLKAIIQSYNHRLINNELTAK